MSRKQQNIRRTPDTPPQLTATLRGKLPSFATLRRTHGPKDTRTESQNETHSYHHIRTSAHVLPINRQSIDRREQQLTFGSHFSDCPVGKQEHRLQTRRSSQSFQVPHSSQYSSQRDCSGALRRHVHSLNPLSLPFRQAPRCNS